MYCQYCPKYSNFTGKFRNYINTEKPYTKSSIEKIHRVVGFLISDLKRKNYCSVTFQTCVVYESYLENRQFVEEQNSIEKLSVCRW